MPEADVRVISAFHAIGMCQYTMGGIAPIPWTEINAYSDATKNNYFAWEKEAIREMSEQYVAWYNKGKENLCPAPYDPFLASEGALKRQRDFVNSQWKRMKAERRADRKAARDKTTTDRGLKF